MKPLILDYVTNRKNNSGKKFFYNYESNLNVVKLLNSSVKPFVDMKEDKLELVTTTKEARERDDIDVDILELEGKTRVQREEDYNFGIF